VEKLQGIDQVAVVSNKNWEKIRIIHGLPGKMIKISNEKVSKMPEKGQFSIMVENQDHFLLFGPIRFVNHDYKLRNT
jgi:hypothetical protein